MPTRSRRRLAAAFAVVALVLAASCTARPSADHRSQPGMSIAPSVRNQLNAMLGHEVAGQRSGPEETEMLQAWYAWFYGQRMAPGNEIPAFARISAVRQAQAILGSNGSTRAGTTDASRATAGARPVSATAGSLTGPWTPLGPQPIDAGDPTYSDPSNGSVYPNGFHEVSGRVTALAVTHALLVGGKLIVGTDVGAFVRKASGQWAVLGAGLPNVAVIDLNVVPGTRTVIATTHGRGVWTLSI
jgi:hypothetical protein